MPALEPVLKVLRYRGRPDLAALLANSSCEFDESNQYGSYLYSTLNDCGDTLFTARVRPLEGVE